MKKSISIFVLVIGLIQLGWTQQAPTINSPANAGHTSMEYWSRAGNLNTGNNLFGTKWNSPIYTITGNNFGGQSYRMKVNGIFSQPTQYAINNFGWNQGVNTTGYILMGNNNNSITDGQSIFNQKGAFSLLHLNGETASNGFQEFGYRPWMKTGITLTGNRDLSYFGLRQLGLGEDITETTIVWSDNAGSDFPGPDDMVFRFTSGGGSNYSTNFSLSDDMDGLHISRFTSTGLMGLGNTFGVNVGSSVNYNSPRSLLHQSYQFRTGEQFQPYGFMQITYRRAFNAVSDITGQGETENDGLRWGIDNIILNQGGANHLNGFIRWQENSALVIQSEWDNTPGGVNGGERIRFTSIGSLVNTQGLAYGGLTTPTNITRIAISHNGAQSVTRPLALMHLGYNMNSPFNGWRPWMDIGTFTTDGTDHIYVGLKDEGIDRRDAVVGWGDNQTTTNGPDNLRFIFSSNGTGSTVANSLNGLETGRFYPGSDETFTYLLPSATEFFGRFGVGDFTASGVNEDPTHKIDVVGNGRFRYLPDSLYLADENVNKIVMVDSMGVLRWATFSPTSLGASCSDTVNGQLLFDTKIDLNNHNFYFVNNDEIDLNYVGVGYDCSSLLPGKLSVHQVHSVPVNQSTTAVHAINDDESAGDFGSTNTAVLGHSFGTPVDFDQYRVNRGGDFYAANSFMNNGVLVIATEGVNPNSINEAGLFRAYGGSRAVGIQSVASSSTTDNIGVIAIGNNGQTAYGIFADANGAATNYAGYFVGNGVYTGSWTNISDSAVKTNITQEAGVLDQVMLLNPVNYTMRKDEFEYLGLSDGLQHGFISQEVQEVFPELVQTIIHPAQYDSLGVEITPQTEFLGLNYNGFISLNTAAIIELNEKITEQQATIDDLNARLTTLENCLLGILPMLCQMNNTFVAPTPEVVQNEMRAYIDVELNNQRAIVLDQNVPNPFAETTVITYSIPESVSRAQIHFYDASGNLIKSVEITERGDGQLNVFGQDLSSGVYTYSLVTDGQLIATKKMVKQ